ncbi:G5 domain-containing protein [Sporosarcina gallistercoris]|uniref:G5 domain-containing protein n=1 Tax=Sporosarcina gallistercoris TaxID=2762245 RepID=A0ABR8PJY0_9BACL|nr:G5 domain-containing protein [Sporosarcina gallistercoris]MBD7908394.1 G5 domain-containing protein [Sporosarcina gallistercoris]
MGNRTVITYFLSIMGASLLFFGIASAGSFAAETLIFGKRFGDHTYAGPFNLSKQTDKEAEIKLTSDLLGMQDKLQVDLLYQDATIPLPVELVEYNPSATIEKAKSEAENSLIATVSEDGLRTLLQQQLPMLAFNESELQSIANGISEKLESGIMPQSIILTDYLESTQTPTVIASASTEVDGLTAPMLDLLSELDGSEMEPKTPFSLLEFIENTQPGLLDEEELTVLASTLYRASLQTNFWIEDRTIRHELTQGIEPGFEAAINAQLGLDYVMTNPNYTSYTVHANWESGSLNISIEGMPLRYEYKPYVAETHKFEPKTVVQYSEDLSRGQVRVAEPGKDGFEVIVQRKIMEDGTLLTTESVSEDFYPPVSRVEQLPLVEAETDLGNESRTDSSENNGTGNDSDSATGNGDSSSGNDSTSNQGSTGGSSNGEKPSGSNEPSGNPGDPAEQDDGKPMAKPGEEGYQYDKGGNLIK